MKTFLRFCLGGVLVAAFVALTAHAYVLMPPPHWPDGTVTLTLKLGSTPAYSDGSNPNSTAAIAAPEWNPYMARLQLATSTGSTGQGAGENGQNEVFFSKTIYGDTFGEGVLAVTLVWDNTTQRTETDVIVNQGETWDSYRGNEKYSPSDLRRVLVHEFGHVIGLGHPDDFGQQVTAIMNSYVSNIEVPQLDDEDGVAVLYGHGSVNPPRPPTILSEPVDAVVVAGKPVQFQVTYIGTQPMTFQWRKDDANISDATSDTYVIQTTAVADTGHYSVVVTNIAGTVTSRAATLIVVAPTAPYYALSVDTIEPSIVGDWISLDPNVSGTSPISFQWFKNGIILPGETYAVLDLHPISVNDAGVYTLLSTNTTGSTTSPKIILALTPPSYPTDGRIDLTTDYLAYVNNDYQVSEPSYQWFKNAQPIPGAVNSFYTPPTGALNERAEYVVVVTNPVASVTSQSFDTGSVPASVTPMKQVQPDNLAYSPSAMFLATDDTAFLLDRFHGNVFRWSASQQRYLDAIPLTGEANTLAFDAASNTLYTGYADGRIGRIVLAGSPVETPFSLAAGEINSSIFTDNYLFTTSFPSVANQSFDLEGNLASSVSIGWPIYPAWNQANRNLYYIDNGEELYRVPITTDGKIGVPVIFPDYPTTQIHGPIWIEPGGREVLTNTGSFYDADSLEWTGSLSIKVGSAAWIGNTLYTARDTLDGIRVERWTDAPYISDRAAHVDGRLLCLFALSTGKLLVIAEKNGAPTFTIADQDFGNLAAVPPEIVETPLSSSVVSGNDVTLSVGAQENGVSYQWNRDGLAITGAADANYTVNDFGPADSGIYVASVIAPYGVAGSIPAIVGNFTTLKVDGSGTEVGSNIRHPNGNYYDQVLLQGAAASVTADSGQVTRTSYIDSNGDIVQVEFAGAGTLSLVLTNDSGPAAPVNYTQPSVAYMQGDAGIVITGADETTNVSVFTVGRATAFDPTGAYDITKPISSTNDPAKNGSPLFQGHDSTNYDGIADIRYIAILSRNGNFGGLRASNARFDASAGQTGVYAPGVQFVGPVYVGNIDAHDTATPVLILGSASDTRITGGNLAQTNSQPVEVSGITQLKFTAGTSSAGTLLPAQHNQAVLEQDGNDVTEQIVVNPNP